MTTFFDFVAGNVVALGVVGVLAVLAVVVFTLGGDNRVAPRPTRPVATAADLTEHPDAVAVVGTVECDDPLTTPFLGDDAVAYEVAVSSSLGHVATLSDGVAFTLVVDDERVSVTPGDPTHASGAPVVDHREHERIATPDDDEFDAGTREVLAGFDATRFRLSRYLSGSVLPKRTERTYRITSAGVGDEIAVVGHLKRVDGEWLLAPNENESLRFLDPTTVHRDA